MIITKNKDFCDMTIEEKFKYCNGICISNQLIRIADKDMVFEIPAGTPLKVSNIEKNNDVYNIDILDSKNNKTCIKHSTTGCFPLTFIPPEEIKTFKNPDTRDLYLKGKEFMPERFDFYSYMLDKCIACLFGICIVIACLLMISSSTRVDIKRVAIAVCICLAIDLILIAFNYIKIRQQNRLADDRDDFSDLFSGLLKHYAFAFFENYDENIEEFNIITSKYRSKE